ncbi:choline kinase alpha-like isoform X3 [Dinothrombium tinctorium]|uniref:Choline kinase alpha-like isoform X3 n=1 Tax=Dinothrombium tinctorium TaxID=1965070 RepID=A0A3S5WGR0_9ACAR|nr:choline kinase alpha-like isoform X3 [Dinothrombium tinctorium]
MNEFAITERIHKVCSDFLSGKWSEVKASDIEIKPIEMGVSNRVFAVSLPKWVKSSKNEPMKVLVRFYGSEFTGKGNRYKFVGEVTEAVVFSLLAERNFGPKLFGIFDGGRIEEFIESRSLTTEEIFETETLQLFARKIAQIHCMKMPVSKKQVDILAVLRGNFEMMSANGIDIRGLSEQNKKIYRLILEADFKTEVVFIHKLYTNTKQRQTFCHNDLNPTNFLLKCDNNDLVIIDFENCFYNFRGIDLGKFFSEPMIILKAQEEEANFCASDEQIRLFVRSYLNALKFIDEEFDETIDNEDTLMLEIEIGILMIHIFTSIWNLLHPQVANDAFYSIENCWLRYQVYKKLKIQFCQKYSELIQKLF